MKIIILYLIMLISANIFSYAQDYKKNQILKIGNKTLEFKLDKISDKVFKMRVFESEHSKNNKYCFRYIRYPVLNFYVTDVNGDGILDIVLCVAEKNDLSKRRVIVFQYKNEQIRKLWIGSRLGNNLINCDIIKYKDRYVLVSFEKLKNEKVILNRFYWSGFGFMWDKTLLSGVTLDSANNYIKGLK